MKFLLKKRIYKHLGIYSFLNKYFLNLNSIVLTWVSSQRKLIKNQETSNSSLPKSSQVATTFHRDSVGVQSPVWKQRQAI